jgi:tetratricopeptide (TPR) repeat protein
MELSITKQSRLAKINSNPVSLDDLQTYIDSGHYQKVIDHVEALSAEGQSCTRSLLYACQAFEAQSDYPGALKCLHEAIDLSLGDDPILFDIYKAMGNIYLKCGDIDSAEEKYNLAHGINSEDESLLVNYGVLAIQKGDFDQAKQRFAHILENNNKSDVSWVGMALVHRSFADAELSRACLLRALDENPMNKLAITNFYQWCLQDGVDANQDYIEHYLSINSDDDEMNKLAMRQRQ